MAGFVERKLRILDWKTTGAKVTGRLLQAGKIRFKDGGVGMRYKLEEHDGTIVITPGATQLDMRVKPSDVGCYVHIEYLGEDESRTMSEGRSRPKLFKYMVDESSKQQVAQQLDDAPPITDDDIPF